MLLCYAEINLIGKGHTTSTRTSRSKGCVETSKMISAESRAVVLNISMNYAPISRKGSAIRGLNVRSTSFNVLRNRKHIIRKLCYDYLYGFCKDGPDCKMVHVKLFNNRDVHKELRFTEQLYKLLKETGPY